MPNDLSDAQYAALLELRTGLRRFLRSNKQAAEAVGLSPAQYQLLLAIRAHDDERGPTIGDVADALLVRHHSAVDLVNRAEADRLVRRRRDPEDHRVVRLELSARGRDKIRRLSASHLDELGRLGEHLRSPGAGLGQRFVEVQEPPAARSRRRASATRGRTPRRAR